MKRLFNSILLAVILLLVGCSGDSASLMLGKYVMSNSNDISSPYVTLKE